MLFTVKEVAERLKTSKNMVYVLINLGLLKSIRIGGKKIRDKSLEEFLDQYDGMDVDAVIEEKRKEDAERGGLK